MVRDKSTVGSLGAAFRMEAELCFPQLLNASCLKLPRPPSERTSIYVLLSSVSLLTVVLNLLVIVSISHFRQLHTPTNLLLLSLAVSDLLVGLLVMPFQMFLKEPCWILGDLMCVLYYLIAFITICSSVVNMVLISADRYVAICAPLTYPTRVTESRVQLSVVLCWGFSAFYSFFLLFDKVKEPGSFNSCYGQCVVKVSGAATVVMSFIVPISSIVVLYVRVFAVAVVQARAVRCRVTVALTVQRSELKAARTLGVVVAVFLLCYCPYYCVSLSGSKFTMGSATNMFISFLVFFNSCLNPVIYAFFYPWFRKSVKLIVSLEILQQNSCRASVL